jgi:hypothetical protein
LQQNNEAQQIPIPTSIAAEQRSTTNTNTHPTTTKTALLHPDSKRGVTRRQHHNQQEQLDGKRSTNSCRQHQQQIRQWQARRYP